LSVERGVLFVEDAVAITTTKKIRINQALKKRLHFVK